MIKILFIILACILFPVIAEVGGWGESTFDWQKGAYPA